MVSSPALVDLDGDKNLEIVAAGLDGKPYVWHGDGSEMFWVFPAMCAIYGFTRLGLKRRITGEWDWWGC